MIRDRSHLALDPTKKRGKGPTANDLLSPVNKEMLDYIYSLISPDRNRSNLDLQNSLQALTQGQNEIPETPTPTRIIFPKDVTKDQENFAEGFQQALQQLQQQNSFVPTPTNRTNLPSIFNLLAAITPTLTQAPSLIPPSSSVDSPLISEADTKTSDVTTLSPTAVVTSSISPLSNESGGSLINTSTCSSTSSSSGVNLAEVQRKLTGTQNSKSVHSFASDPTPFFSMDLMVAHFNSHNHRHYYSSTPTWSGGEQTVQQPLPSQEQFSPTFLPDDPRPMEKGRGQESFDFEWDSDSQNYMDIFQQSDLSGFSNFIGHHPNNLIPANHLPPQSHPQVPVSQHPQSNGYPMSTSTSQTKSDPQLSVAVSTLAAAAAMNSYGGHVHQSPIPQQRHQAGGPQRHLNGVPSTSNELMGFGQSEGLDLEEQERRKLERKRARNRMAASKCRQRKLERIQELELQLQAEREKNVHLLTRSEFMRNRVDDLTKLVEQHRQNGCAFELPHWYRSPPLQHDMNM
uniref:BZIP domain-containing protein n=1 Tax=Bursaphelenchus xylophilus TaxID=6326 RepID=A0A1I7SW21_BURXY